MWCLTAAIIAEGIAVKQPGELIQQVVCQYVDEIYCVSESRCDCACNGLSAWTDKIISSGAGATALAALLAYND